MATLRELKGRIGSVASSEKITGAMKMISSAKMHRAEADLRKQLPYRGQIESIIGNLLSADAEFSSPLTEPREVKRVGIVVLGSDDGLCGGYNINIFKELLARLKECRAEYGEGVDFTIFTIGRKIHKAVAKLDDPHITVAYSEEVNSKSGYEVIKAFAGRLGEQFLSGGIDTVKLLYMNFQSVSRQRLRYEQYLPVDASTFSAEGSRHSAVPTSSSLTQPRYSARCCRCFCSR